MKKIFSTRYSDFSFNLSMFLIRVGFAGLLFLDHGLMKINKYDQMKDAFSDPVGLGSHPSLLLALFAEIACAALWAMGLLTRLVSFVLVLHFLTIIFIVHKGSPLNESEMPIFYLIASITTLLCGPGKWSIDRLIGK
ncbi:MAG: DoxX family protein [Chitinophagaceae bacterium]|jgi:putative oxidoreductase|nr:DoxX family protein [Chitinophagaceae bacterium]